MAEIELSVLSRQCLDRRVPDFESLQAEARSWQERRDATDNKIEWFVTVIGNRAFVEDEASGIIAIVDERGRATVWGRLHAEAIELEREDLELLGVLLCLRTKQMFGTDAYRPSHISGPRRPGANLRLPITPPAANPYPGGV